MTRDAYFRVTRRRTVKESCLCDPTDERLPARSRWQRIGGDVRAAFRRSWICTNCGGTITTIVHMTRAA